MGTVSGLWKKKRQLVYKGHVGNLAYNTCHYPWWYTLGFSLTVQISTPRIWEPTLIRPLMVILELTKLPIPWHFIFRTFSQIQIPKLSSVLYIFVTVQFTTMPITSSLKERNSSSSLMDWQEVYLRNKNGGFFSIPNWSNRIVSKILKPNNLNLTHWQWQLCHCWAHNWIKLAMY